MFKKIKAHKYNTYSYYDYVIEIGINESDDYFESWLYNKNYGVKMIMFGTPLENISFADFVQLVKINLLDYIQIYMDTYEQ